MCVWTDHATLPNTICVYRNGDAGGLSETVYRQILMNNFVILYQANHGRQNVTIDSVFIASGNIRSCNGIRIFPLLFIDRLW